MSIGNVSKNGNHVSVFMGDGAQAMKSQRNQGAKSQKQESGKSIFAGNLNMMGDRVEQKRKQARERAMRTLNSTFADEKKLDATVEEQKQRVSELKDEFLEVSEELKNVKAAKEQYIEEYGLNEEDVEMTPEQRAELMEFEKAERELSNRMLSKNEEAKARNKAVEDIMVERLKSHPMVDAQKEADDIMEEASAEIIGMLRDEAKDHIDETMEENKEKAEEAAKKKEEEQEKLEKKEETPAEQAAAKTAETMGDLQEISQEHKMLRQELKVMVDTNEILEEDLKGLLVDQQF